MDKVMITMEGGIIQNITSTSNMQFIIVDHDKNADFENDILVYAAEPDDIKDDFTIGLDENNIQEKEIIDVIKNLI